MLYVTGCLEEAGVIFSGTAFDKDVAVTLVILIHNINSFYNSLDQSDQNLRLRILCIFCKGEQPFFCHFQVTDGNHIVLSAFIQFGKLPLRFPQFFSQIFQILLNKLLDTAIRFSQISCLRCDIRFQLIFCVPNMDIPPLLLFLRSANLLRLQHGRFIFSLS